MRPRALLLALVVSGSCAVGAAATHAQPSAMPAPARCADAALPITALDWRRAKAALRCLLTHERAKAGAGPLWPMRRLARAARAHTTAMVAGAWFGHEGPARRGFSERLRRHRLRPRLAGETLAWGCGSRTSPAHAVAGWLASPPHRRVILDRRYTRAGLAFRRVAAPLARCRPGVTWTLILARF